MSQTHIPPWIYVLLIVLGWNEIMSILSSPLYLFLFLLCCLVAVGVRALGLTPYVYMVPTLAMRLVSQAFGEEGRARAKSE